MGSGGRKIQARPNPRRRVLETQGAWVGVRDVPDPATATPERLHRLTNAYPADLLAGLGVRGRPGARLAGTRVAGECQCLHQYTKLDGTQITLKVVAGEIYTYSWAGDAWTKVIETSDLTGASITLATTGRIYAVTFADVVIFSDGTNAPFSWDGTTNGGLTALTSCPPLFGKPVVHYAKLFGIKAAERSTMVWSEENQPNVGYEAGGYNNAWTLGQTEQERLFRLMPTNEALYYQRARSTGAIWGAVNADFRSAGTHEAISPTVGGIAPAGWTIVGSNVFFVDADGRMQVIQSGGGGLVSPEPWHNARTAIGELDDDAGVTAEVHYLATLDLVIAGAQAKGSTQKDRVLVWQPDVREYAGTWTELVYSASAIVQDDDDRPRFMFGDDDGYVWYLGHPDESGIWNDQDTSGTETAIPHVLETAPFAYSLRDTKLFQRVDVGFVVLGVSNVSLKLATEAGRQSTGLVWAGETVEPLWNSGTWDTDEWSAREEAMEVREPFGIEQIGRYCRVRLEHSQVGERFGVMTVAMEAYIEGADVRIS